MALVSPSENKKMNKKITLLSGSTTQSDSRLFQILASKLPPFRKRCSRRVRLAASSPASTGGDSMDIFRKEQVLG